MKRSQAIALVLITAGALTGCGEKPRSNGLRPRLDAQGQVMKDSQGNPMYEDDEGQHYSYHGGSYYPFFTRMNGFSTIPGTGIAAPASASGVPASTITSRQVRVTRGGFGSAGSSRSSGGGWGGFSFGG